MQLERGVQSGPGGSVFFYDARPDRDARALPPGQGKEGCSPPGFGRAGSVKKFQIILKFVFWSWPINSDCGHNQCNFTCGSVRRLIRRTAVSSATLIKPCSAYSC